MLIDRILRLFGRVPMVEAQWHRLSDEESILCDMSGRELAQIISGGWDRWSTRMGVRHSGFWYGRANAMAAAEKLANAYVAPEGDGFAGKGK